MFDRIRAAVTDKDGQFLTPNGLLTRFFIWAFAWMCGIMVVVLLISVAPWIPLAIGGAAAILWWKHRYGWALPPEVSQALEARKAAKAAAPPAEKPTLKARAAQISHPTNRDKQIGGR
jgi:hypothetical protein